MNFIAAYYNTNEHSAYHHVRLMLNKLISNYNFKHISYENVNNEYLSQFKNCSIIFFDDFDKNAQTILKLDNVNTYFIVDDIHHSKRINNIRQLLFNKSKGVFSMYYYLIKNIFKSINVINFPHSGAYSINYNFNPIKKILLTGHITKEIYPIRYELSISNNENLVIFSPDYNGYKTNTGTIGLKYYKLLNTYFSCITDESIRNYILAKPFEIMSSGSLLLYFNENTKSEFEKLGYIDGIHYISLTKSNYTDKLNYVMNKNNIDEMEKVRLTGYNYTINNHTWNNRLNIIIKTINLLKNE